MTLIDFDKKYYHPDYPGVAWYIQGYNVERQYDGFPEWAYEDYEEVEDVTKVRAIMVGDDRVFLFDTEDMVELDDGDYCTECGQIGCKGDFRE